MIIEWVMNTLAVMGLMASIILGAAGILTWGLGFVEFKKLGIIEGAKVYLLGGCFVVAGGYLLSVCVDFLGWQV